MTILSKLNRAQMLLPLLLIALGCGTANSYETPSKRVASKEKSASSEKGKTSSENVQPDHASGDSESDMVDTVADSDESISIPTPVTATFLTCGKPHVINLALNIDCALKDAKGLRVEAKSLGDKVVYGVDSKEPDKDVLVTTLAPAPADKDYDVRYAIFAKDITHIEKVVDSSTFFVTVTDTKGNVIENAVKSFLGVDIDFPSPEELKKMFLDKISIGRDILGI